MVPGLEISMVIVSPADRLRPNPHILNSPFNSETSKQPACGTADASSVTCTLSYETAVGSLKASWNPSGEATIMQTCVGRPSSNPRLAQKAVSIKTEICFCVREGTQCRIASGF